MARTSFYLTKNQQQCADEFILSHLNSCPKVSKEERLFVEYEEQAEIVSTYKYSFIPGGVSDRVFISCDFCGEEKELHLSDKEIEEL